LEWGKGLFDVLSTLEIEQEDFHLRLEKLLLLHIIIKEGRRRRIIKEGRL
jgi:hypothetical protein